MNFKRYVCAIFNKVCLMHLMLFQVILAAEALTLIEGASKWYTGDNKPYEFGYAIEGNQHRHESKGKLDN